MTTETVYTENIAATISHTAGNLKDLFIEAAGDYADDYDIDAAVRKFANALTFQLWPLGITQVLDSGEVRCPYGADIDNDKAAEVVRDASEDINDILDSCSIA